MLKQTHKSKLSEVTAEVSSFFTLYRAFMSIVRCHRSPNEENKINALATFKMEVAKRCPEFSDLGQKVCWLVWWSVLCLLRLNLILCALIPLHFSVCRMPMNFWRPFWNTLKVWKLWWQNCPTKREKSTNAPSRNTCRSRCRTPGPAGGKSTLRKNTCILFIWSWPLRL